MSYILRVSLVQFQVDLATNSLVGFEVSLLLDVKLCEVPMNQIGFLGELCVVPICYSSNQTLSLVRLARIAKLKVSISLDALRLQHRLYVILLKLKLPSDLDKTTETIIVDVLTVSAA